MLSLILLLAALAGAYLVLVKPAIAGRQNFHTRLDKLRFQYTRLSASLSHIDAIRADLKKLKQQPTDKTGFITDKQRALAAADLQRHINTLISSSGGDLISTQVTPDKNDKETFPAITVKVHVRADIDALQKLLYQLAAGNPVLTTDNLLIQSRNTGLPGRRQREENQLDVRFDVTGFIYRSGST